MSRVSRAGTDRESRPVVTSAVLVTAISCIAPTAAHVSFVGMLGVGYEAGLVGTSIAVSIPGRPGVQIIFDVNPTPAPWAPNHVRHLGRSVAASVAADESDRP